ncbi:hypothetical protein PM082_009295 [Marasmius tenuissimus]|nr:hypothetical protein PM082_009295 [Marasmius tenuissimus]
MPFIRSNSHCRDGTTSPKPNFHLSPICTFRNQRSPRGPLQYSRNSASSKISAECRCYQHLISAKDVPEDLEGSLSNIVVLVAEVNVPDTATGNVDVVGCDMGSVCEASGHKSTLNPGIGKT